MTATVADGVGFRSKRGPVLIALMVSTGLVAIDSTILATAVPSVVADLGGFAQFPWLFSIYLLTQAVAVPIYAKLADTVGRKPIILLGVALFLVGSVLCGVAWSMPALIAFRALQGLGAGAIQPMAITIAGDIYTVAERARVQGYIASVWAISSVVGPTLGGIFSEFVSWRWIFFVNVPLCLLAGWLLFRRFHESVERRSHRIDYTGSALLTVGVSALILGLLEGDQAWPWLSVPGVATFVVSALALIAFVVVERRAPEPVLPLTIFSRPLITTTTLISLGIGAMLLGLTSYVPTYLEGALGVTPLLSGLALASLTIGWPITASQAGRLYLRLGFKPTILLGVAISVAGTVLLAATASTPSLLIVAIACFITGLGFGLTATPSLIAAQSSVGWEERGVITGANLFARSVGSAVGVAVFGALANAVFAASASSDRDPAAVTSASTAVFLAVACCSVITIAAGLAMPAVRASTD
ncbi:MFS transporter [Cnuibacter sp. UC19_7]|uniref:MFS transporter n=1 Tax=Cnuibacter sp. UC19_7 TaxID=3350166 RepID=UPI00367007FA